MKFLTVYKVKQIIDLAELVYGKEDSTSNEIVDSKTQAQKLVEFLFERRTPGTSMNTLTNFLRKK